jgi:cystathionine beta-lyase
VVISSKNRNSVYNFINSLKLFGIGQSWGGFESLVLYQNHVIQRVYKKYVKQHHHIVRFHIGLEDPKDLILDLKKGLKKIK